MNKLTAYTNPAIAKELGEKERIIEYLRNGKGSVKLSMTEMEKYDRYDFIDNQIRENKSSSEIIMKVRGKFGISRAQAFRDVQTTKEVFGSVRPVDKPYYKSYLVESVIETIRMAKLKKDLKAKNMAEANLIKLLGFDKEDSMQITPEMFQQNILMVNADPEILGLPRIEDLDKKIAKYKAKHKPKDFTEVEMMDE